MPARPHFLESRDDGHFRANSCRTPWRIGTDAAVLGDAAARSAARRISTWARRSTGGRPSRIVAGYTLSGRALTGERSVAFTAPLAVAAMSDPGAQRWLDSLWRGIVRAPSSGYYADSIRLQSMLVVSRNWWLPGVAPSALRWTP